MTPPSPDAPAVELAWTQRLALRLAHGDRSVADDLVGDAWALALAEPQRVGPGWMRRVLERLASNRRRTEARRRHREQAVARPEREAGRSDPSELLARAQLARRLSELVLALDEPFREVVLLRYLEGLGPSEIARHQGVPVPTVKARLARALELLRGELERSGGGRTEWLAGTGLSALEPRSIGATTVLLGGVVMKVTVSVAAVVAAAATVIWVFASDDRAAASGDPAWDAPAMEARAPGELPTPTAASAASKNDERVAVAEVDPAADEAPARPVTPATGAPANAPAPRDTTAGRLVVPPEWQWSPEPEDTLVFTFDGARMTHRFAVADLEPVPGYGACFGFTLGVVPRKPMRVTLDALGARWAFEEPVRGRRDLELVVPLPAEVEVSIVTQRADGTPDGVELEDATLSWSRPLAGASSTNHVSAKRAAPGEPFVFRAPEGTLHLTIMGHPNAVHFEEIEVFADRSNRHVVALERPCGIELRFLDADGQPTQALNMIGLLMHSRVTRLDEQGEYVAADVRSFGGDDQALRWVLEEPGPYRFTLRRREQDDPDAPPPPTYDVTVRPGSFAEVLVRAED